MPSFSALLTEVRDCTICAPHLPHGVRPVVQIHPRARVLIAGQAPGRRVHESGVPFDDPSGDRLRDWMGVTRDVFYDPTQIAILPMGFCFPARESPAIFPRGQSAHPPGGRNCLRRLRSVELTLLVGQYAQAYHLAEKPVSLTETVKAWRDYWPAVMPLPHHSPRNNI